MEGQFRTYFVSLWLQPWICPDCRLRLLRLAFGQGADPEGAKEVTTKWKSHTPKPVAQVNVLVGSLSIDRLAMWVLQDFRYLNKSALDDGKCRTATEQKVYRQQNPK